MGRSGYRVVPRMRRSRAKPFPSSSEPCPKSLLETDHGINLRLHFPRGMHTLIDVLSLFEWRAEVVQDVANLFRVDVSICLCAMVSCRVIGSHTCALPSMPDSICSVRVAGRSRPSDALAGIVNRH
jgi:hypothetical protein